VHEFRALNADQVRELLTHRWSPAGVVLPDTGEFDAETVASIIRVTGGNFRLLGRLLTQVERILQINRLNRVTGAVIDAARESLVIGQL
jgi:DNA transposition AAA+ family ATPase